MRLPLLIAAIFLSSCAAPVGRLNPGAQFPYEIVGDAKMSARLDASGFQRPRMFDGGYWTVSGLCASDAIYELQGGASLWTCAHEIAHRADILGSYRAAIISVTPPHPSEQMAARLAVLEEIDASGPDYWRTIYLRWGRDAIGGHAEILAHVQQ